MRVQKDIFEKKLYSFNRFSYIAFMENFTGYQQSFQEALVEELLQLNPRQLTVDMVWKLLLKS